jgi:hypothetical protein
MVVTVEEMEEMVVTVEEMEEMAEERALLIRLHCLADK